MTNLPAGIKQKINVTISTAAIIFIAGVIFNAGMQYDIISNIRQHQSMQDVQIASLQTQLQPINQQLSKQSQQLDDQAQLLKDIKYELLNRK